MNAMINRWSIYAVAKRSNLFFCVLFFTLASSMSLAQMQITVKGLFKNTAVVIVDGQQRMLKVGKKSPEGILLLEADSQQAIVEIMGKRQILYLGQEIGAMYETPDANEVRIVAGHNGHHSTIGKINGRSAKFLVDTGASSIAINSIEAEQLGINYKKGRVMKVSTANGHADGYLVNLESVTVGTITLNNINAIVINGSFPDVILLGNTFLSQVNMRTESGVLVLQTKY